MGVPFSREIEKASHHIDTLVPTVNIALWTIIWVSIILLILIATILVAFIALLITVNPDLERERKALVTPVLRALLKVPRVLVGMSSTEATSRREGERSERPSTRSEKRTNTEDEGVNLQGRRR